MLEHVETDWTSAASREPPNAPIISRLLPNQQAKEGMEEEAEQEEVDEEDEEEEDEVVSEIEKEEWMMRKMRRRKWWMEEEEWRMRRCEDEDKDEVDEKDGGK